MLEDSLAGVQAGRNGAFGWVVGVDRRGAGDDLRDAGADAVHSDLTELQFTPVRRAERLVAEGLAATKRVDRTGVGQRFHRGYKENPD